MAFNPKLTQIKNDIIETNERDKTKSIPIEVENFDILDYVRVTNVRGDIEYRRTKEEKVIIGHRANPILGNKHPMKDKSYKERERVIAEHKKDLDEDLKNKGPIWKTLQGIAKEIVVNKQKFAIECWCKPLPCHNDMLIPIIVDMAKELLKEEQEKTNKPKFKL